MTAVTYLVGADLVALLRAEYDRLDDACTLIGAQATERDAIRKTLTALDDWHAATLRVEQQEENLAASYATARAECRELEARSHERDDARARLRTVLARVAGRKGAH